MSEIDPQRRGEEGTANSAAVVTAGIVDAPGAAPRVGSVRLGRRGVGSTLIEVVAAPLNPLDLLIASGNFHSARHELTYVPGSECVGVVIESEAFATGTLVYAECHVSPSTPGAFADRVLVHDADVLPLPAHVDPILAAALGNSGTAAYIPLIQRARLAPGETVLVLGATGAVGQLAVQLAKLHGAGRVIGVARNVAALDALLLVGADAVVALDADESVDELVERLNAVTGAVDVVLDGLYGRPLEAALRVCGMGARIVNVGNLAGATATVPAGLLRAKQISLTGFAGLHTALHDKQQALDWLWGAGASGEISVAVHTYPLSELPTAWAAQSESPHAKCVILPGNEAGRT